MKSNAIKLEVPYYSQLNNNEYTELGAYIAAGNCQCNPTSNSMALAFIKPDFVRKSNENGFNEPESYFNSKLYKYGEVTDHQAITQCLRVEFKINSEWKYNLSKIDIVNQLNKKVPVPAGFAYKSSGHICCIVGYDDKGFYIHDPYGIRKGANDYYDVGAYGAFDHYSWHLLDQVFWDQGAYSGWGRIFF